MGLKEAVSGFLNRFKKNDSSEYRASASDFGAVEKFGPYKLGKVINKGTNATIYRATQRIWGGEVALKLFSPEACDEPDFQARFYREMLSSHELDHPNISRCLSGGDHRGKFYLVYELTKGEPLSDILPEGGLQIERALKLGLQMLQGLEFAHKAGVLHRDIKPQNLIVFEEELKIIDFALARSQNDVSVTTTGTSLGTPAYMAPEMLIKGAKHCDTRADQYSCGAVFYEMLTGKPPREGWGKRMVDSLDQPIPSPSEARPEVPQTVDAIVTKMLQFAPEQRYASVSDPARALEDIVESMY